jgi:hypothetical protein
MKPESWSSWFPLKSSPTGSCRCVGCCLQNVPRELLEMNVPTGPRHLADCTAGMCVFPSLYLADCGFLHICFSVWYVYISSSVVYFRPVYFSSLLCGMCVLTGRGHLADCDVLHLCFSVFCGAELNCAEVSWATAASFNYVSPSYFSWGEIPYALFFLFF